MTARRSAKLGIEMVESRPPRWQIAMTVLAGLTAGIVAPACEPEGCSGLGATDDAGAPVIDSFHMLPEQVRGDPWTVVFGVELRDRDGNLGGGTAEFYLNAASQPATQKMADAFRQSGLALAAVEGEVWMALRFSDNVANGTEVDLGLQLVDAAGMRSNCYTLRLRFAVSALSAATTAIESELVSASCNNQQFHKERRHGG